MATGLDFVESLANPLDVVEEIVSANGWLFDRATSQELYAEMTGDWCGYRLCFTWTAEMHVLHVACTFDLKLPAARRIEVNNLLALANERLWLGHFEVDSDGGVPAFRHSILLRGTSGPRVEQLEDLVDIAVTTSERFYPAFQYVIWGGHGAEDAIAAAILETVGEA
jgi:hypothetical protein